MAIKDQYLDERFIAATVPQPPLPFFHSCEAIHLQPILDSGELQPRHCKVYDENLLYSFYGKPAYKSGDTSNSRLNFMMPLCFIINYGAILSMKRLVAFDSGAFSLYKDHLHESMTREEFELTPSKDTLNKMVNYFYDNNDAYFNGKAKKELDYDPVHFQLESYVSLLTTDHKGEVDDRKASLEVQLDYSIPLNSSTIDGVILPKMLSESPTVKKILSDTLGIKMIPITNYGVTSRDYYVHVMEKTKEYLVGKKLLNGS
jgi:hypothetical protein